MFSILAELSVGDYIRMAVEVAVLTFAIYRVYIALSDTKATEVIGFIFGLFVVYLLCYVL